MPLIFNKTFSILIVSKWGRKMKSNLRLNKSQGFSLIEVILTTAIFSISMIALASLIDFVNIHSKQSIEKDSLSQFRTQLINALQDKKSWLQTVSTSPSPSSSSLLCIKENTCTSSSQGNFINVKNSIGGEFYDSTSSTSGFDAKGIPCNSFSLTASDEKCPYRYDLSWSLSCPSTGACLDPGVKVVGTFTAIPGIASLVKNTSQLNFSIYINSEPNENAVAITDTFYTMINSSLSNIDLLSNDYAPNGTQKLLITWVGVHDAGNNPIANTTWSNQYNSFSGSTVTINPDGKTINYTPDSSANPFYGLDYFEYTITDQLTNKSTTGKVWIKVMTPFTWTGNAGNSNWSTPANWCGSVLADHTGCVGSASSPSSTSNVVFDDTCSGNNCNANNSSSITVASIRLNKIGKIGYQGNFSQNSTITINSGGYTQQSGTFTGSNFDMTSAGPFDLSGGTFKAPQKLILNHDFTIMNTAVFNHANGMVYYSPRYALNTTFNTPGVQFYKLHLGGAAAGASSACTGTDIVSNFDVLFLLDISDSNGPGRRAYCNSTINVLGDAQLNKPNENFGSTKLKIAGSTNQTISSNQAVTDNGGTIGDFEIASTGGTVTLTGNLNFGRNVIYTSGNVDVSTAEMKFRPIYALNTVIDLSAIPLNNVRLSGATGDTTIINKLVVLGDLTIANSTGWPEGAGSRAYNTGTVEAHKNILFSRDDWNGIGNYKLKLVGNTDQTFTSTVDYDVLHPTWGKGAIGNLEFASTATVKLIGAFDLYGDFIYTSGNVDVSSAIIRFKGAYGNYGINITPGPIQFENLLLAGGAAQSTINGTLYSKGTITTRCGAIGNPGCRTYSGGLIKAAGDINFVDNVMIKSNFEFIGNNSSILAFNDNQITKDIVVNKTGKLSFNVPVRANNTNQNFTIQSGTVETYGNTLQVKQNLTLNAGTSLILDGGSYTYGTLINNGTIVP